MDNVCKVWSALNVNSGSIQAISALLSVIITAVLVIITARYVKLTKMLADVSASQLLFLRDSENLRRKELKGELKIFIVFFKKLLIPLPKDSSNIGLADIQIREAVVWSNDDIYQMQKLAAHLGEEQAQNAADVSVSMRFIKSKIEDVKSVHRLKGYEWAGFLWKDWIANIEQANRKLNELNTALED